MNEEAQKWFADQLEGIALMRAVVAAVGWPESAADQVLDWDWAIAACEAAGLSVHISFQAGGVYVDGYYMAGVLPESLCRALLAVLEARDAAE